MDVLGHFEISRAPCSIHTIIQLHTATTPLLSSMSVLRGFLLLASTLLHLTTAFLPSSTATNTALLYSVASKQRSKKARKQTSNTVQRKKHQQFVPACAMKTNVDDSDGSGRTPKCETKKTNQTRAKRELEADDNSDQPPAKQSKQSKQSKPLNNLQDFIKECRSHSDFRSRVNKLNDNSVVNFLNAILDHPDRDIKSAVADAQAAVDLDSNSTFKSSATASKESLDDEGHQTDNNDAAVLDTVMAREAIEIIKAKTSPIAYKHMSISGKTTNGFITIKNDDNEIDDEAVDHNFFYFSINVRIPDTVQAFSGIPFDNGRCTTSGIDKALLQTGAIVRAPLTVTEVEAILKKELDSTMRTAHSTFPYTADLVKKDPSDFDPTFDDDPTKTQVYVVAGESGSGKSRFAVNAFPNERHSILRYSLRAESRIGSDKKPGENEDAVSKQRSEIELTFNAQLDDEATEYLRTFIELITLELFNGNMAEKAIYSSIRAISNDINQHRNTWALALGRKMLDAAIAGMESNDIERWYEGREGGEDVMLEKLVIVFDECGRSPDFVAGIIATARDSFLPKLRQKKLAHNFALVLCGSGLEAIQTGTANNKYLGTDPALTSVVILERTVLANLPAGFKELKEAIEKGVYSRVLASNVRMLTRGLLPVLMNEMVTKHVGGRSSKQQRQIAFGSFREAMDYCVRVYVNLNGLREKTAEEREQLLNHSFRFMVRTALRAIRASGEKDQFFQPVVTDPDDEDLFNLGLVTRDPTRTSNALRYLACNGKTVPDLPSDGVAFELVVAAHLERYLEAFYGIEVEYQELAHAWPPAVEKGTTLDKEDVQRRVNDMATKGSADIAFIVECFQKTIEDSKSNSDLQGTTIDGSEVGSEAKEVEAKDNEALAALVLRQGIPNAQGADVMFFLLKRDGTDFKLELSIFQAKNWTKTRYRVDMNKAAQSIGIDTAHQTDTPTEGSAGYSYQATIKLGKMVAETLEDQCTFQLTKRAIVFAYEHEKRSQTDEDALLQFPSMFLWSREMLEPTISALVVAPDGDDTELCEPEDDIAVQ